MFLPKSPSMNLQKALSTVMAFHSHISGFHVYLGLFLAIAFCPTSAFTYSNANLTLSLLL